MNTKLAMLSKRMEEICLNKIILKGHIVVPKEDLELVLTELPNHIELTRREEGCLVFEVTQDESEKCKFNVYEEFLDELAFKRHQARVAESKWGAVAKNAERHYQVTGLNKS